MAKQSKNLPQAGTINPYLSRRSQPGQLSRALGVILMGASLGAIAEQGGDPSSQAGSTAGGFQWTPVVSLSSRWDDNIYGQPSGEVDDRITNVAASIKGASQWQRNRLGLEAGVSTDRYEDYNSEDATDWWAGADGRYDLSAKSHVLGGVRLSQDHEDRSSPDSATGALEPTTFVTTHGHVGFAHYLAPFTFRLGAVFENLNFKDGSTPGFDVDQRDRDQYSLGVRFSYQTKQGAEWFFQAATDTREYDDKAVGRDSDGYRLGLGMRVDKGPGYQFEGFVGYMTQNYDEVALRDVGTLYYGMNMKWKPSEPTQVTAYVDRAVNETTLLGISSHVDTTVGGRVEHKLNADFSLNASLVYVNSDYQGTSLELDETSAGFGARYYFNKCCYVGGDYRHINRNADDSTYEYTKSLYFLSVGYAPRTR